MDNAEFAQLGEYVAALWPGFTLNREQAAVWRDRLGHVSLELAREAVRMAYAESRWKEPYLGSVAEALGKLRKLQPMAALPEVPQERALEIMAQDQAAKKEFYGRLKLAQ